MKRKVVIAGAGLGGLCLAQMLRRAGVEVEIFERDAGPWERAQGYRLHIDADGVSALSQALPGDLLSLFEATSMRALPYTTIVDTNLRLHQRLPIDEYSSTQHHVAQGMATHVNVDRATLRQILLAGLDDVCHFNASISAYESDPDGVTAILADGRRVRGDLLVGADGIRSAVRAQRAPTARMVDTGVRCIYGRLPMAEARRLLPVHALADVFTLASDSRKVVLGMGGVIFPMEPSAAANCLAPHVRLTPREDYIACIVAARPTYIGRSDSDLRKASSDELQRLACNLLSDWPDESRKIPAAGEPGSFFYIEMYTSVPCALEASPNVTLLGDAIHAMSPSLGRGANLALHDAAQLGRRIIAVQQGEAQLAAALRDYEMNMTEYGFQVVRRAAEKGAYILGQVPLPE